MHGIVIAGQLEQNLISALVSVNEEVSINAGNVSVKRSGGAYRISSHMRSDGWDMEVLDFFPSWDDEELEEFFESRITNDTKFVGISVILPPEPILVAKYNRTIAWLKDNYPDVVIVCGSKNLITTVLINADYHLTGYGENGITELMKHTMGKESSIGLQEIFVEKYERHINWVNCDTSHPAFPHEDMTMQYQKRDFLKEHEVLTMEFSRGCKFRCSFCSYNVLGFKDKTLRDMDIAEREMQQNFDNWGISHYTTADETFNANPNNLSEIAKMVQRLPFTVDMTGFVRADLLVNNRQTWDDMLAIGHWGHYYGVETFNHEAGKFIKKGMNPDKLKQGLLDVREYFRKNLGKYNASLSFIVGLPYEDAASIRSTFKWLHKVKGYHVTLFPLYLANADDKYLSNNYSDFDKTWKQSNLFYEMHPDDASIDYKRDFGPAAERYKAYFESPEHHFWAHDDMNFYEANKLVNEFYGNDAFEWYGPCIWSHHLYKLLGWSADQIGNGTLNTLTSFSDPDWTKNNFTKKHREFFDEYKFKKLSYS